MKKVIYNLRFFHDTSRLTCVDYEEIMFCDKIVYDGNLAHLYRGGYCQRCVAKSDILSIEEI